MVARVLPEMGLDAAQRVVGAIAQIAHEYLLVLRVVVGQNLRGRVAGKLCGRERMHVVDYERGEEARGRARRDCTAGASIAVTCTAARQSHQTVQVARRLVQLNDCLQATAAFSLA